MQEIILEAKTKDGKFVIGIVAIVFMCVAYYEHDIWYLLGNAFIPLLLWQTYQLKEWMHEIGFKHTKGGQ